jgi:hypothetical protein
MWKKMAGEEKDCAEDVKLRNHFVSNRFFLILIKSEGKNAIKLEKLKDCVEKHEKNPRVRKGSQRVPK